MSASAALALTPPPGPSADPASAVRRSPPAPCLIEPLPNGLVPFPDLAALAGRLAQLLAGRPFTLKPGVGHFSGYDTFPKVTVWAGTPGFAGAEWLAAAVLLDPRGPDGDVGELTRALIAARRTVLS